MPIHNQQKFQDLISQYHQSPEKFAFFVGAGLSQPLFPSWGSFLGELLSAAKASGYEAGEEVQSYIKNGEYYLDIAEACVSAMGNARYRDVLERVFDKEFASDEVPEAYRLLIELSPNVIVTTNYDRIPEVAGAGAYRIGTNKTAAESARAIADGRRLVFKMHGDIQDHSSIILKSDDYQSIMIEGGATRNLLNSLLSTRHFIFLGFSLSDPHIGLILDNLKIVNSGIPVSHYVFLNELSSFKTQAFERRYGVQVIAYTPQDARHPEVVELLRALKHTIDDEAVKVEVPRGKSFSDKQSLQQYLKELLFPKIPGLSFFIKGNDLVFSFAPIAETRGEMQRELLGFLRYLDFECDFLGKVVVMFFMSTGPSITIDDNQRSLLFMVVDFSVARRFALKEIASSTLWGEAVFCSAPSISEPFDRAERLNFPLGAGVVGD